MAAPQAPHRAIAFTQPTLAGHEVDLVNQAMNSGDLSAGGRFAAEAEALLGAWHRDAKVLLTTSCTTALELAALTLDVGPTDVVAVPSFTFPTTASAFARSGAKIRFVDIDPVTLGIDPASLERSLDDRVTTVVPVHYGGTPCDIEGVLKVADEAGVTVVEDNANGIFTTLDDRPLGTFGRMSTVSFHQTKSITCGEGGALVLNQARDVDRAEILADRGTDRRQFLRGERDAYTWQLTGSSFGLGEVPAAFLIGQLRRQHTILERRRNLWDRYHAAFTDDSNRLGITLPHDPGVGSARHGFYLLIDGAGRRDRVLAHLNAAGIGATFHYQPLHRSPAGIAASDRPAHCPVSDRVSAQLLRLPFHNGLTDNDVDRVASALIGACRSFAANGEGVGAPPLADPDADPDGDAAGRSR